MPSPRTDASLLTELELETEGFPPVRIQAPDFIQQIEIESTSEATWSGTIVLYDKGGSRLEDVVIGAGSLPTVRFRFNWQEFGLERAPLFTGQAIKPTFVWMPDGVLITLEITSIPVIQAALDKRTRSYQEGLLISDIVREIADERGWPTTD